MKIPRLPSCPDPGKRASAHRIPAGFPIASTRIAEHTVVIKSSPPPVALTIAGSDSSAGAGVQADLKTFAAHGVHGVNAITAIVAEAPGSVTGIHPVPSETLRAQVEQVFTSFPVSGVKTGMLARGELVEIVCAALAPRGELPLVVDPVVRASAGSELLDPAGVDRLKRELLPLASLATPNLPEAELLLGSPVSESDRRELPRRLYERYGCDFLVKGGHGSGDEIVDHACIAGDLHTFPHPRLEVGDVHGTGCALSAAILARLCHGADRLTAIGGAIDYLAAAIAESHLWPEPRGTRALNPFPDGVDCPPT